MAKFTETYAEYLETHDGQTPAVFSQIQGFDDLFVGEFCDKEIGFETETLFEIKLDNLANIVIPKYKERIDLLTTAMGHAEAPTKTRYEHTDLTYTQGQQVSSNTDLPINASTATPSLITNTGNREDSTENTKDTRDSGYTPDELLRMIDYLNGKVYNVIQQCLREFDKLFMKVY